MKNKDIVTIVFQKIIKLYCEFKVCISCLDNYQNYCGEENEK